MHISELSKREQKEWLKRLADGEDARDISEAELEALAEGELSKAEAGGDMEIVALCDELLCRLHGVSYDQSAASNRKAFRAALKKRHRQQRRRAGKSVWRAARIAAVAAVLVLCTVAAEITARRWRTSLRPTQDGEQLAMVPAPAAEPMIASGEAEGVGHIVWELHDVKEVPEKLGYRLPLPAWLPDDVSLSSIDGEQGASHDMVTFRYYGAEDRLILIDYCRYVDAQGISFAQEQSENGKMIPLENGKQAYISRNLEVSWGLLVDARGFCQVSCRGYDEATLLKILNAIGE